MASIRNKLMNELEHNIRSTMQAESQAILDALNALSMEAVECVVKTLSSCGRIITSGCGTSGAAARKIAHTFSCIERPALFLEPSDAVHGGLGVVQSGDAVILLSKGGATPELSALAAPCKAKGAFVIGVSENPDSPLAKGCDLLLSVRVKAEPDEFNMLATASILAVLSVFDAIAIAVAAKTGFTREQFALIHPGGAVGARLSGDRP